MKNSMAFQRFNINLVTQRILLMVYGIGVFALSVYFLYFFFQTRSHLISRDAAYYMSIADSLLQTGSMQSLKTIPAGPVITPQNGIVPFYLVLSRLGLAPESQMMTLVFINYLLHLTAIYPLYKIALRVGLRGTWSLALLLGLYIGAWHIYRFQLRPLNDGVFNPLAIWFMYLIIDLFDERKCQALPRHWWLKLAIGAILSVVLIHFRLQTLLIIGAAFLAALLTRRYRSLLWSIGLIVVAFTSLGAIYTQIDTRGISQSSDTVVTRASLLSSNFLTGPLAGTAPWFSEHIPYLLLYDLGFPANLIYLIFAVALGLTLFIGLRRQETGILFIGLMCLVSILFVSVFFAPRPRYLLYIFPFLYLLILLPGRIRPVGYIFISLVLLLSLTKVRFVLDIPQPTHARFWLYLHEQQVSLPADNPLLLSEDSSSSYLFLGARHYDGQLTMEQIMTHGSVFLVGGEVHIQANLSDIERLADKANYYFKRRNLTPDYQDEQGNKLLQLYEFEPKSEPATVEIRVGE